MNESFGTWRPTHEKIVAAIAFALLACMTVSAQAVTLTVTEGSVLSIGFAIDTGYNIGGDGFSASGVAPGVFYSPGESGLAFALTQNSVVIVGDLTCDALFQESCGNISLTHPPLTPPAPDIPFTVSAPFTATGVFDVGEGFDFVGRGIVTATFCLPEPFLCAPPNVLYRFTVAEPPSALLVATGALAIGGLMISRMRAHRG
jgi:hypothetical protein